MKRIVTILRTSLRFQWLSDWMPILALATCLWLKLVYRNLLYYSGMAPDNVVHITALAIVALLVGPLCLLPAVPRLLAVWSVNLIVSLLLLADTIYSRRFWDIITVPDLSGAHQLLMSYVIAAAIDLLQARDGLYFLDIAIGALLIPFYASVYRFRRASEDKTTRSRVFVFVVAVGVLASVPAARLVIDTLPQANRDLFRSRLVGTIGVVPYHVFDVLTTVMGVIPEVEEPTVEEVRRFFDRHLQHGRSRLFGIAEGKNIILIQAESLSAFPIGLTIDGRAVAPNLLAFSKESIDFRNFFDQTYGGGTSDGEFTALTSLHPLPEGAVPFRFADNHFRGLPRILSDRGYATLSACTAHGDSYFMSHMHPSFGFHASFFEPDFDDRERFYWITDRQLFAQMLPRLGMQKSPFMAFLVTSSNHLPYAGSSQGKEDSVSLRISKARLSAIIWGSVHDFDTAFGEFLRGLRERGLLDTSVIVLYGDHTGMWRVPKELPALLGFPAESPYDRRLVITRLPLLIRLPEGRGAAGPREDTSGHLDIAPTILGLLGVDKDDRVMLGRDLTPTRKLDGCLSRRQLR